MRDDERYPIPMSPATPWESADSGSSLPQVSAASRYHDDRRDKYLLAPAYDAVGLHHTVTEGRRTPAPMVSEKPRRSRQTILGLQKRVFWAMAGVITTLMIVGVVVGAVIGSSTGNSSAGNSPSSTTTNSPMVAADRQIGAATMNITGSTTANIQVVYQDLQSTDLLYRLIWDDIAGAEQRISSLDPAPQQQTPIAVTTANTTTNDGITTNIFYLSINAANYSFSDICQVTLQCSLGAENCTVSAAGIISDEAYQGVLSNSGLSAAVLPDTSDIRVYYKNGAHAVRVLAGNGTAANGWVDSRVGSQSFPGSSIAVNYDQIKDTLQVIFVNSNSKEMQDFTYSDPSGVQTQTALSVVDAAPSGWYPAARFSSCFQPGLKQHHIYYVDSTGVIYGVFRGDALDDSTSNWNMTKPPDTGTVVGGIASVAWDSQVRLLYMTGNTPTLSMSINNNSAWSTVQAL